jgi:hypothetical protein
VSPEEDAVSEEVESSFDLSQFAEVRITVRLPGSLTSSGEPERFDYAQVLLAEQVRMVDYETVLPRELERIMRLLVMSLRFR